MKALILIIRVILGLVFAFSGSVKAIDPLGSCYKFTDYFTAFGMPGLSDFSLPLAFILAALEFTTGIMLIFNLKPRWAAWMSLIFMIVFTPLTLYIWIMDPVHDCGCFGDAIIIPNNYTFYKNVLLLIMAIFLVINRKKMDNPLSDNVELGISVAVFAIAILFESFMVRHLPIYDFRPYKIGNNIAEKMAIPEGAPHDKYETILVYENTATGEVKEFTQDNYPWNDSTWVWKDTKSNLIEKGFEPEIHDLTMADSTGNDFTEQILNYEKPVLLVVMHKLEEANVDGLDMLFNLQNYAEKNGYAVVALTSSNWDLIEEIKTKYSIDFPFLQTDDITLKTMIRANPGIMKLEKGTITGKWNFRDFDTTK